MIRASRIGISFCHTVVICALLSGCAPAMFDPRYQRLSRDYGAGIVPDQPDNIAFVRGLTDEQFAEAVPLLRDVKVRSLSVSDTSLTDASVPLLLKLPRVEDLDVSYTGITEAGIFELARHPRLRSIVTSTDQMSSTGVERFGTLYPRVELIVWPFDAEGADTPSRQSQSDATTGKKAGNSKHETKTRHLVMLRYSEASHVVRARDERSFAALRMTGCAF